MRKAKPKYQIGDLVACFKSEIDVEDDNITNAALGCIENITYTMPKQPLYYIYWFDRPNRPSMQVEETSMAKLRELFLRLKSTL